MNSTEKLISLVQPHPCLYNTKDKNYKNTLRKDILWEKISKELNQSCDETKTKWKNLKDGYKKYKKQIKGTTGQQKKYINWVWGPYLQFLDSAIQYRPTTSNIVVTNEVLSPSENTVDFSSRSPASSGSQLDEDQMDGQTWRTNSREIPIPHESPPPRTPVPEPPAPKKIKSSEDDMDKVLKYLNNKKKKDAIDFLFSSYAETFKKLKPRTQAEVKLELAKIFTDAELRDLDAENSISFVPILSPSYSLISSRYDNDQDSPKNPIQIVPEDLSIPIVIENDQSDEYIIA